MLLLRLAGDHRKQGSKRQGKRERRETKELRGCREVHVAVGLKEREDPITHEAYQRLTKQPLLIYTASQLFCVIQRSVKQILVSSK